MTTISDPQFEELSSRLTPTLTMLDALCHRNKNQHRHSSWWRHVCILRRAVRKLIDEELPNMRPERVRWLGLDILPITYISFTQLTADNQFAQLGITLITMLATIHEALQHLLPSPEPDTMLASPTFPTITASLLKDDHTDVGLFDMGVAISRPKPRDIPSSLKNGQSGQLPVTSSSMATSLDNLSGNINMEKGKKRNKQTNNSFDSIFEDPPEPKRKSTKIIEAEPISMNDIFGTATSKPKKKKAKSSVVTKATPMSGTHQTIIKDVEQDVNFDDIFGEAAPKPRKKKAIYDEDDIGNIFVPTKLKEKKTKTKETIGFEDIFGDIKKKGNKKKKPKSGSGTDMSDIFAGL